MTADEVHVFVARPGDADLAAAESSLPADERAWARSFRFERHRREHAVSRALLRQCLSRYRSIAPDEWRWSLGQHGKPEAAPPCGLYFNASNHVDLVVCAVALHPMIGVDVEPLGRSDAILEVAQTVFSAEELAGLAALEGEARADRAVTLWTAKEAYIKALGLGMAAPLKEMTIDATAVPPLVVGQEGWFIDVFDHEDARIAVAIRGPEARPCVRLRTVVIGSGW